MLSQRKLVTDVMERDRMSDTRAQAGQLPSAELREGGPAQRAETAAGRRVLFVAWRDLASPRAGGSEVLVDELASGLTQRGYQVTLLCGGRTGERPYRVVRSG